MKYIGEFTAKVEYGGQLPRPKIKEVCALEKALEIYELIDGFTYEELNNAMDEIRISENPNKAHLEIFSNVRDYKHILNRDTYTKWY